MLVPHTHSIEPSQEVFGKPAVNLSCLFFHVQMTSDQRVDNVDLIDGSWKGQIGSRLIETGTESGT